MAKKAEILQLLDLPSNATDEEIEQRCEALLDWLESDSISEELRPWAIRQARTIQRIYDGLDRGEGQGPAEEGPDGAPASGGGEAGTDEGRGVRRPSLSKLGGRPLFFVPLGAVLGLAILGILWGTGVAFSGGEDAPTSSLVAASDPGQFPLPSQERVEELKLLVAANPGDAAALFELGESFIVAEDWEEAIYWFEKLLEVEPTNTHARIDIGTANMNLGRDQEAQDAFSQALAVEPENIQAHYNLAFLLAFRGDTPNLDEAVKHWQEVVRLAPESNLAGVARVHLDQFQPAATLPDAEE